MQRFLAVLLVLVLAVAGVGYLLLQRQHAAALKAVETASSGAVAEARAQAENAAEQLARDTTRVLALAVADPIGRGDTTAVDALLADTVQGDRLVGVMVLDPSGEVLCSTDLRWRGRRLDDADALKAMAVREPTVLGPSAGGELEVAAPVEVSGVRVATVRASFHLGGSSGG
jgi:preprotein translocase subunit SecG